MTPLAASPIDRLKAKLTGMRPDGPNHWMAKCPSHDDKQASLSITLENDQKILMHCHAKCRTEVILAAIGLSLADLFVGGAHTNGANGHTPAIAQGVTSRPKLVKTYDYYAADGTGLFQTCRFEPKTFRQRHRDANGNWVWKLDGITPVLYRLPEIMEAVALRKRIFVVEGEKDADTLVGYGYDATTSPMGAGKWREAYSQVLAGADVYIVPDNDDTGRAHAEQVAASLTARGCAVRIVTLPNLPPKGDVTDWLDPAKNPAGDLDVFETIIDTASIWTAASMDARHKTRWRLDELWANEEIMRPPPPVVPYLAWLARATLLAAREKSGKSTLTGYLAAMVSRGGDFLGEPCAQGPVLIIGLEEFIGDTARRLKLFHADPKLVHLVDHFACAPDDRPAEVLQHIEAVKPVLVILDSLIAYARGTVTDANNATQTQATVQSLADICHQTGVALIIIHHARKADGKYRDSSAIGGAVDVIAEVFPPEEFEKTDPTRRRVRPVGRVPARGVDFRFTGQGYELVDIAGPQKGPLDQRIAAVVRDRPGISGNDVCEAIGEQRQQVLTRITHMITNGAILNDGDSRRLKLRLPSFAPASAFL